jgi:hypothetical protein
VPMLRGVTVGDAPEGVRGRVQYGPGVKARLVYLRAAQFLPFGRAAATLGDLCRLRPSTGTIATVIGDAASRLGRFGPGSGPATRRAGTRGGRDPGLAGPVLAHDSRDAPPSYGRAHGVVETSLDARRAMSPGSPVAALDALLKASR